MLKRFRHTQIAPVEGYYTYSCHVRVNSSLTLWRRSHDGPKVDVNLYWGSLHFVHTLLMPLLANMYIVSFETPLVLLISHELPFDYF